MRQAVMIGPGRIEFREVHIPESPGSHEGILKIERIGICGSDVHVFHGEHPATSYPVNQGHEFAATVQEVGSTVKSVKSGMKATAWPQLVCGRYRPCKRGQSNACLVAQFARIRGAKKVLITDISDFRLKIARECGIEGTVNVRDKPLKEEIIDFFGEEGFQVGFEAAGAVKAVDTVGAGDSFTAALVVFYLKGMELKKNHHRASELAAFVCTNKGATPKVPKEFLLEM